MSSHYESGNVSRTIDLTGDSAEIVALALLRQVAQLEGKTTGAIEPDRKWLLDTYAECLAAARGERNIGHKAEASSTKAKSASSKSRSTRAATRKAR